MIISYIPTIVILIIIVAAATVINNSIKLKIAERKARTSEMILQQITEIIDNLPAILDKMPFAKKPNQEKEPKSETNDRH